MQKEKEKQKKIYNLFEDEIYDIEEYKARMSSCKSTIKELEDKIKPLQEKVKVQENIQIQKKEIIPKIENVIDIYNRLETAEEKNILLKSILEKVTYLKTEKAIKKTSDPTNFEIHIYPKLPRIF